MTGYIRALVPLALITSLVIAGPLWREDEDGGEDAGTTPNDAQGTDGVGAMLGVSGRLEGLAGGLVPLEGFGPGPIPDDFQDVYIICIDDPEAFVASTCSGDGFSEFDARLYLFTLDGFGIVGNNMPTPVLTLDAGPPCPGTVLRNAATDATGSQVIASGVYLLAITTAPFTPLGADGEPIFFFGDPKEISGPDGPDGGLPLTDWTAGAGTCCTDGQCSVQTQEDCQSMGGEYQGEDVLCADVSCELPVGACFLSFPRSTGAVECIVTTEADCESMNGSYEGDGTECPPTGACIVSGKGTFCFVTTEAECDSFEGDYLGDGSICPGIGACLISGGLGGGYCLETTEGDCDKSGGDYQGDGTTCDPPLNDDCDNSIPVSDGTFPFDNVLASTDGPSLPGANGACLPTADVWYEYVAPFDGLLTVSTCNDANFDTVVAIFDGCSCPVSLDERVACDDDASGCETTSIASTFVSSGSCYLIQVGGWEGDTGAGSLTIETVPVAEARAPSTPVALGGGDTPELDGEYTIIFQGVCFATSVPTGACELPDESCMVTTEFECLRASGTYQGDDTQCATVYRLSNHPEGSSAPPAYGLRLDELIDLGPGHDVYSFDFDAEGCAMYVSCTEDRIHIFGTAFGGRDRGIAYDPLLSGFVEIDFVYDIGVQTAPGDDDKIVVAPDGSNGGTITFVDLGLVMPMPFFDYAGNFPYTFRFGDEDDDMGHRGVPGRSGWGWLVQPEPDSAYRMSADWLFRAELLAETAETSARSVPRAPAVPSGRHHSERTAR